MGAGHMTESVGSLPATLHRTGRVVQFDVDRGLGMIGGEDGRDYPFHCVAIADGSRDVSEGTEVAFVIRAGNLGRWEAWDVVKLEARPAPRRS